jgi:hypothetical protein
MWRGRQPCPETPLVIDDIVEVITIMSVFPLLVVLSYPLTSVVVGQVSVATG